MYSLRSPAPWPAQPWKPGISFLSPWICYCGYFTDTRSHHVRPWGSGFPHVALRLQVNHSLACISTRFLSWRNNIDCANKLMYETASEAEKDAGCQGESGGGRDWEAGLSRCKLVFTGGDKQHGPAAEHQERAPTSCDKP